jgi:hypothetical protein
MHRTEISRREWPDFFARFASAHRGHLCSVAVQKLLMDTELHTPPLLFTASRPETDTEGARIRLAFADFFGVSLMHLIQSPRHVFLATELDGGIAEKLEIDGLGGRTVLRFEPPS